MTKKEERQRILFVGAIPPAGREVFGGIVTSCKVLLNSSFASRADLVLLDSTQLRNPPPALPVRGLLAAKRFLSYLVKFERSGPDVVLLFASSGASLLEKGAMAWYARFRRVPALMFPRGGAVIDASHRSRFARTWVRYAFGGARKILCQGPAWHRFAVDLLGFAPQDAPLVPNWTATPALLAIGKGRRFDRGDRPVRLLFLGWLERSKGVLDLIEACRRLSKSRRFLLDIVGEGHASKEATNLVRQYGLGEIVRFRGWLQGPEVGSVLAEADALVLPSWAEGLPNAMIEAMSARLAIVASAVGNIPDVVTDGREALLVPRKDVDALHLALERIIDDEGLRRRLGDAAFLLAEREFSVEQAVDRILAAGAAAIVGGARDRRKSGQGV